MSKSFFKLAPIVTPLHALATIVCNLLALRVLFDDVRYLSYPQRLSNFLGDLFLQPLTAILGWFGIDFGSSSLELVFLLLNSLIWGAAIAWIISMTRRRPKNAAPLVKSF
jgi:hypothetical protein